MNRKRIIFVTGTDTGVGKTLFTALFLCHLRGSGVNALAMKPFCSGARDDVVLLHSLQDGEISRDEINPYFFAEPVAPIVAGRKHRRGIPLTEVVAAVRAVSARCDCLLVEGAGGLMVPLGEGYTVRELIGLVAEEVIVVAANRLGTISHTLLTVHALQAHNFRASPCSARGVAGESSDALRLNVVLMNHAKRDTSSASNERILRELLAPVTVTNIPFLGENPASADVLVGWEKKLKKTLARFVRDT